MDNVTSIANEPAIEAEPPKPADQKPESRSGKWPEATRDGFLIIDKHGRPSLVRLKEGDEKLVSGGIWVKGLARDYESRRWCNVIQYVDQDNNLRTYLMPRKLLAGHKHEVMAELLERGLFVVPGNDAKANLFDYVSYGSSKRYRTVNRTGWQDGCFVLPDQVIGDKNLILSNESPLATKKSGSLESWRDNVAALCVGNSRLVFGISCGFASPLLDVAGVEGGGFHFVGTTSLGKTKALIASTTVFGTAKHSWNLTTTWLEATAATHSHIGLALDEIGEADPHSIGQAIYMLANENGRGRGKPTASAKPISNHKLITLTNGEKSLGEHMASVGKKTMAGQEVRLINIEADAGMDLGIFENIHESHNAAHFADSFDALTKEHTGHAGPEFVRYVIDNRKACKDRVDEITGIFFEGNEIDNEEGQVKRVAKRFALVAAAGEIATTAGITGWKEHEALKAAGICYKRWRENWTVSGGRENEDAINTVRAFLQIHQARFISRQNYTPQNCAGHAQDSEFWIYPQVFKDEVCSDIRQSTVAKALQDAGFLVTEGSGKKRQARRSPRNEKQQRFYVIRESILRADDNE